MLLTPSHCPRGGLGRGPTYRFKRHFDHASGSFFNSKVACADAPDVPPLPRPPLGQGEGTELFSLWGQLASMPIEVMSAAVRASRSRSIIASKDFTPSAGIWLCASDLFKGCIRVSATALVSLSAASRTDSSV